MVVIIIHVARAQWGAIVAKIAFAEIYSQITNTIHTLVEYTIFDHSDIVGFSPTIINFILGFNILRNGNCNTRRDTFKFWDLVRLKIDIWRYWPLQFSHQTCIGDSTKHARGYLGLNWYCFNWSNHSPAIILADM